MTKAVTHYVEFAARSHRTIRICDGEIVGWKNNMTVCVIKLFESLLSLAMNNNYIQKLLRQFKIETIVYWTNIWTAKFKIGAAENQLE